MDYFVDVENKEEITSVAFTNYFGEVEKADLFDELSFRLNDSEDNHTYIYYKDIDNLIKVLQTVKRFKAEGRI